MQSTRSSWFRILTSSVLVILIVNQSFCFPANDGNNKRPAQLTSQHEKKSATLRRLLAIQGKQGECLPQLAECDPYGMPCCGAMKCGNSNGNYCLFFGSQACFCLPHAYGQRIG